MKKILVINGNSKQDSYCHALSDTYAKAAVNAGNEVELIHLSELDFNAVFQTGYDNEQPLEEDLIKLQESIKAAEHIVIVFPTWWGSVPALLKGALDRTFLPGFAFKYRKGNPFPEKLLKGRSARLIITMDTPPWYNHLVNRSPANRMMKKTVLQFSGINPVKVTEFGPILNSSSEKRDQWLRKVEQLGKKAA